MAVIPVESDKLLVDRPESLVLGRMNPFLDFSQKRLIGRCGTGADDRSALSRAAQGLYDERADGGEDNGGVGDRILLCNANQIDRSLTIIQNRYIKWESTTNYSQKYVEGHGISPL